MDWRDLIETALHSLRSNKLRSALMLLGLVIGVAAVIIVVAIGSAGQKKIEKELETFGINSVWIWREWENRRDSGENFWTSNNEISNWDVIIIDNQCEYVSRVAPVLFVPAKVSYRKEEKSANILGITPAYHQVNNEEVILGRLLTEFDNAHSRKVCVLPLDTKDDLLENIPDPLGKKIRVNKEKFTIVGVLAKKDRGFLESIRSVGGSRGNEIYIPLAIAQDWHKTRNVSMLQAEALAGSSGLAVRQMETVLNRRHQGVPKFKTESMEEYIKISNQIMGTLSVVLGIIAGISLFVGGLGITNIMLVSVTERTREIGVRKAVGATQKDIVGQFLTESVILSLLGGSVGMLLGMLGVGMTAIFARVQGLFSLKPVLIAFFASVIVGILAGFYPAKRAAKLDPITSLRYE